MTSENDKKFISKVTRQKAMDWICDIAHDLRTRMENRPESDEIEWSFKLNLHDGEMDEEENFIITKKSEFDYEVIIKCTRKKEG